MSEQSERTSERTYKWLSTYVWILDYSGHLWKVVFIVVLGKYVMLYKRNGCNFDIEDTVPNEQTIYLPEFSNCICKSSSVARIYC